MSFLDLYRREIKLFRFRDLTPHSSQLLSVRVICMVQPYLIGFLVTQNREINGERTVTSRPSSTQTFSRYKQAGGGALIPVTLLVEGPQCYKEFVLGRIRFTLPECENVEDMHVECLKVTNIFNGILRPVLISEFCFSLPPHYNMAATKKKNQLLLVFKHLSAKFALFWF